jgi:hypothetical protein
LGVFHYNKPKQALARTAPISSAMASPMDGSITDL